MYYSHRRIERLPAFPNRRDIREPHLHWEWWRCTPSALIETILPFSISIYSGKEKVGSFSSTRWMYFWVLLLSQWPSSSLLISCRPSPRRTFSGSWWTTSTRSQSWTKTSRVEATLGQNFQSTIMFIEKVYKQTTNHQTITWKQRKWCHHDQ